MDLKKAAKAAGAKKADLIPMKDLLPLTGYIRGGCSPVGMKKPLPTFFHSTAMGFGYIFVFVTCRNKCGLAGTASVKAGLELPQIKHHPGW